MTIECPKCQTDNPEDSKFCMKCTAPLPVSKEVRHPDGPTLTASPSKIQSTPLKQHTEFSLADGQNFGPYKIIRPLGKGGMGEVYEAEHIENVRRVAVKILRQALGSRKDRERFLSEGRIAASLNHPNSVYIYGTEEIDENPVISMELLPGGTLKDRVKEEGPLPPVEAVDVILQVIEGLEAAQLVGILHRDIKPSNCFVDIDGTTKIGDFGLSLSTLARTETQSTADGSFMGTPAFSSPEQIRGDDLDVRSDIFSVGATLYYLLTGKFLFEESNPVKLMSLIQEEEPRSPNKICPEVSKGLQKVVLHILAKEKEKRFQSYVSLRQALMPYSSEGMKAGDQGKRSAAMLVDWILLTLITFPLNLLLFEMTENFSGFELFLVPVYWFLYFFLSEKFWGRSLGKFIFGLRVAGTTGSDLTTGRVFLRTVLFVFFTSGLLSLALFVLPTLASFNTLFMVAGLVILVLPMRQRNGYAGLHELVSRTRVKTIRKKQPFVVPEFEPVESESDDSLLQHFGPYRPIQTLWETDTEALLLASDDILHRELWVYRFKDDSTAMPLSFMAVSSLGRLHWLQGSRETGNNWDAYEAPSGTSFFQWVRGRGRLSWAEMRGVLLELSTEIKAELDNGDKTRELSLQHIWINSYGHVKLLSFPGVLDKRDKPASDIVSLTSWQDFLHQVVLFGLEGIEMSLKELNSLIPAVPLPDYVRSFLIQTFKQDKGQNSIDDLLEKLKNLAQKPAKISRARRAGPFLITAALPVFGIMGMLLVPLLQKSMPWMMDLAKANQYVESLNELEHIENKEEAQKKREAILIILSSSYAVVKNRPDRDQMISQLRFDPETRERLELALKEYPSPTPDDVMQARNTLETFKSVNTRISVPLKLLLFLFLSFLSFCALPAMLFATVFHGGILLNFFGITVQTKQGKKASRSRCFLRALVGWSFFPLCLLFFSSGVKGVNSISFAIFVILIAVIGAVYAVIKPERSIPDIITGTYLVVR